MSEANEVEQLREKMGRYIEGGASWRDAAEIGCETVIEIAKQRDATRAQLAEAHAEVARLKGELTDAAFAIVDVSRRAHHQLAAEQASHALTRETYERGAQANAAKIEQLREGIAELCEKWSAMQRLEDEEPDHADRDDWRCWRKEMSGKKQVFDALVARLAPEAAVDEPITAAALEREGWRRLPPADKSRWELMFPTDADAIPFESVHVEILGNGAVEVWLVDGENYGTPVPNCYTMRDLRQLVALFTPKEVK